MATKHEEVRDYIERMILDGTIAPGDALPGEMELADTLGVSRNTVRHALMQLGERYRIERKPGRGTIFLGEPAGAAQTRAIGIINSSLMYNIYPELVHGIEDGLYRGGYSMILANGNYDTEKEIESVRRMLSQEVAGLIVEPVASAATVQDRQLLTELNAAGVPVITTNCIIDGLNASYVTLDDEWIGRRAASFLLERGHRRIGCVYKADNQAGVLRYKGFREELQRAGNTGLEDYTCGYSQEDEPRQPGAWCTAEILSHREDPPTAIFYFNDQIAIQAYDAAKKKGLSIPGDLSIISVDNIPEAAHVSPPLTTFNHPKYLMGKIVAEMMLARLGPHNDSLRYGVQMTTELVHRGSVVDLRSRR